MAGSGEKGAKPGPNEERTTERRLVNAPAAMQAEVPRSVDPAHEDFLFHLYRGSELLQDNRIHEAKEELERALTLQPRDPISQDLLAVVYFRIGLFPRAIQIFEQLKSDNPNDPALKLNLALCYLKTGQAAPARAELEDVVRLVPSHKRAWGYLGLAYERTGELDKAQSAFERGGHAQMATRIGERRGPHGTAPPSTGAAAAEVRSVAATAFEELDADDLHFSLAESVTGSTTSGTWRAIEPGAVGGHRAPGGWTVPPSPEAVASMRSEEAVSRHIPTSLPPPMNAPTAAPAPPAPSTSPSMPAPLADFARAHRLVFPARAGVALQASGIALVRTTAGDAARPFAARLEAVRLQTGTLATEVLPRQAGGKATAESLGGVASPLVRISGAGELVLAARAAHSIVAFTLADENVVLREDCLLGFELAPLAYQSGKLAVGDGESAHVVQLHGTGVVLLELLEPLQAIDVSEGHPAFVRRDALIGWTSTIAPRPVSAAEAPSGQRGLLSLVGTGTALLTPR